MFILIILSMSWVSLGANVNVTSNEQYACVMRSEEYVNYNGIVGELPSLFIGLLHISVTSLSPPTIETTLWHSVGFAVNATINGPVSPGQLPPPSALILPLITLTSTNAATSSTNCPIKNTVIVDDVFLKYLRTSKLFGQIQSGSNTGNLRCHIHKRRDAAVAFLGDGAENGMGVFRAHMINPARQFVYLDYWILSKISSASAIFQGIMSGETYLPVAVFESNEGEGGVEENTLPVKLWISTPGNGPVVPLTTAFTGFPMTGPGSSRLILTSFDSDIIERFTPFYRIAYYTDYQVFNTNSSFSQKVDDGDMMYEVIAIAVLFATLIPLGVFTCAKKH